MVQCTDARTPEKMQRDTTGLTTEKLRPAVCGECSRTHKNCLRCKTVVRFQAVGAQEQVKEWQKPSRYSTVPILCEDCVASQYTVTDIRTYTCRNDSCQQAAGILAFSRKSVKNFNQGQTKPVCAKCIQKAQKRQL